jgi:hypothetical protein
MTSRPRKPQFTNEVLQLFVELEHTPRCLGDSETEEFKTKAKRLAGLLGLSTEWWAGCDVNDADNLRPHKPLAAHDYWLTVKRVRAQLLETTGRGAEEKPPQ